MNIKKIAGIFFILLITVSFAGCAQTDQDTLPPKEFYKEKTVELITTGSPGGYDDLLSQVVAKYMAIDLGCTVKVINKQGAGGIEGMNYLYKAVADGLTIGNVAASKFTGNKVMQEPAAEYEIDEYSYLMGIGQEQLYFFVSPVGSFQSVASLQAAKDIKIGGGSASGNIALAGLSVIKLLNLDAKVVTGIPNESDRAMAVRRGEIAGYCLNLAGTKDSVANGYVKPLFVLSSQRDPLMPDIPAITELVNISGEDMPLVTLWETSFVSSSIFTAPPDVPADRLDYLRGFADSWIQNESFRQEINQIAGHTIMKYLSGKEVSQNMVTLAESVDSLYEVFSDLIAKYRD